MIRITGDLHGSFGRIWLYTSSYKDFIIVCGDFGVVWRGDRLQELDLNELSEMETTILFIDGNHENYDLLKKYPVSEWHGGKVQFLRENVIHLMRGQVYEIEDSTFFTMGGAECHDMPGGIIDLDAPDAKEKVAAANEQHQRYRINHKSWWQEELPSEQEMQEGLENLARHGNSVDYILTHCAPTSLQNAICEDDYPVNALTDYLERIKNTVSYKRWFFGHYHENKILDSKHILLYQGLASLDGKLLRR